MSIVLLMNNEAENIMMESLLFDCKSLLKQISNKHVFRAYREANQCVDALAKLLAHSDTHFVDFCNPPSMVETLLTFDNVNMFCNRLINS